MLNNYVAMETDRMMQTSYSIVEGTYFEHLYPVFEDFLSTNLIN